MPPKTAPQIEHPIHILENLSYAVLMFDADLCLEYINPMGEMLFGVSAKRLIGQTADTLLAPDERLLTALNRGIESGHPFTEHEIPITLLGRQEITADCTITPLSTSPTEYGLLVELKQVDRQLRISREEQLLAQQNTLRSLVRGLAHEIKNPLGGLRGAAQLLERELPDESLKEYTQIIIGEADRLRNLVNRMLGPNTLPHKESLNIHQVLEHVRQLLKAEAPEHVTLKTDYDPSIPELLADRDMLIQAILNIASNAVQAVGDHGIITFRTRALRQFTIGHTCHKLVAQIEIIDNGPGIPDDMLESVFFPMVTGRAEGTGLGLSIAQSLINQHDGLIQCESQPGNTRFQLLIPIASKSTRSHKQTMVSESTT
jgi:two-component system nitrogen regulation sensor histidine kinase GlnL